MLNFSQPTDKAFKHIAKHMRTVDKLECEVFGLTPYEGLASSTKDSIATVIFSFENEPLGAYGIKPIGGILNPGAVFWLLGTNNINKHRKDFLRDSRKVTDNLLDRYNFITNCIYAENKESIRWLTWLGAKFSKPFIMHELPFLYFEIRR